MGETYQVQMEGMTVHFMELERLIEFLYDGMKLTEDEIDDIYYTVQALGDGETMKSPDLWVTYYKRGMK